MNYLKQRVMEEPVAAQGIVQAALALGLAFGLHLTIEQTGAILAFTAVILAFLTRKVVTPVA